LDTDGPLTSWDIFSREADIYTALVALILCFSVGCQRKHQKNAETPPPPPVITTDSGIEMVSVPGGWLEMGNESGELDERPVHRAWISPFLLDRYEVTQESYGRFPMPDPSHFKSPQNPCDQINWRDAAEHCNRRSQAEGLTPCYDEETWRCDFQANGYRLPTEAEWEYACRATTKTTYCFGDGENLLESHAWFKTNAGDRTHPVGQKKTNPWGFHDMHGNVAEWCNDFFQEDYYASSPDRDPEGPSQGKERVVRGGSWASTPNACRSSYRSGASSIDDTCLADDTIGFRCARSLLEP